MAKSILGSYTLFRQVKPTKRWKVPGVKEYDPNWVARFFLAGKMDRKTADLFPICDDCKAEEGDPTVTRPRCACVRAVTLWADETLATRSKLLQEGEVQRLREMREPVKFVTLAKVLEVFGERGPNDRAKRVSRFRAIIWEATGVAADKTPWESLTEDLVITWAELRQEAGRRGWFERGKMPADGWATLRAVHEAKKLRTLDKDAVTTWNTSIKSYLAAAKSILGDEARSSSLRGMQIPPVTSFLKARLNLPSPQGYRPIEEEQYAAMWEAAAVLKVTNPQLWAVHRLLIEVGPRPIEVAAARKHWIERTGDGLTRQCYFVLKNRPDEGFKLKAKHRAIDRRIELSADLVEVLDTVATDTSLIGAKSPNHAYELVGREHSQWLKKFLPEGSTQTNYMLRKRNASERLTQEGSDAAADAMGHTDSKMTKSRYASRLKPLGPLDMAPKGKSKAKPSEAA